MGENMSTVIVDIDGTLADNEHRQHFLRQESKDWDSFYAACWDDRPIWPVIMAVQALFKHYAVVLCSGRRESCRQDTMKWLAHYGLHYDELLLRPDGDYVDDALLKKRMLTQLRGQGYAPFLVIDDRQKVVDMWRAEGLVCLQAAPGDF